MISIDAEDTTMIAGPTVLAALWIAWGSDRWDFPPSEVHPVRRSAWHAVTRPGRNPTPAGRDDDHPGAASKSVEPDASRASFDNGEGEPGRDLSETADFAPSPRDWPPDIAQALGRLEMGQRAAMVGQPVDAWRFESVRAGYEGMLKTHGDNPALGAEIRSRLSNLARLEQAAEAARKVQSILDRSHRRDQDLARMSQSLALEERTRSRAFRAIGMIQPSSHRFEGRKLFTLIGADGSRRAYLDVPPGIDADSLIARRVGVRGAVNYDDDLGARLITVRDIEEIGSRE